MHRSARPISLLLSLTAVLTFAAPSVLRVRVHSGDTLSELAARHHTSVARIKSLNHRRSDTIYDREILLLPGNADSGLVRVSQETRLTPRGRSSARLTVRIYVVRAGDNLTTVSRRLHATARAVVTRNHLRTSVLQIGQRLGYVVAIPVRRPLSRQISTPVTRSAADHRATLRGRHLPSKASVREMIRSAARRHAVPVALALALAYQESGFQQRVVSPVDAIGVMQVLPSTGRALARIHGRRFDLLTTSDNVEAGVLLLADLLRATRSVPLTLAGYYQGLGSVHSIGLLPQTRAYITNISLLQRRFR